MRLVAMAAAKTNERNINDDTSKCGEFIMWICGWRRRGMSSTSSPIPATGVIAPDGAPEWISKFRTGVIEARDVAAE